MTQWVERATGTMQHDEQPHSAFTQKVAEEDFQFPEGPQRGLLQTGENEWTIMVSRTVAEAVMCSQYRRPSTE